MSSGMKVNPELSEYEKRRMSEAEASPERTYTQNGITVQINGILQAMSSLEATVSAAHKILEPIRNNSVEPNGTLPKEGEEAYFSVSPLANELIIIRNRINSLDTNLRLMLEEVDL